MSEPDQFRVLSQSKPQAAISEHSSLISLDVRYDYTKYWLLDRYDYTQYTR